MFQYLLSIDSGILFWIQENIRMAFLNPLMIFITHLGDAGLLWILTAIIFVCIKKYRTQGFMCGISLLCDVTLVNILVKNLVARTRPYEVMDRLIILISKPHDYSFPSGHSAASFAVAVVLFRNCDKRIGIPAIVLASLIALSRLYVGVHYPTDVIGGVLLGTLCALIGEYVIKTIMKKKVKKGEAYE